MVIDKLTKMLLGVLAAAALAIGGISMYLTFAPAPAEARGETVDVDMGAACNAYIEGDRPWCAQVFKSGGAYALGVDLED